MKHLNLRSHHDVARLLRYVGQTSPLYPEGYGDQLAAEWDPSTDNGAHGGTPAATYDTGDGRRLTVRQLMAETGLARSAMQARIARHGEGAYLLAPPCTNYHTWLTQQKEADK
jgi:hypothetical protein